MFSTLPTGSASKHYQVNLCAPMAEGPCQGTPACELDDGTAPTKPLVAPGAYTTDVWYDEANNTVIVQHSDDTAVVEFRLRHAEALLFCVHFLRDIFRLLDIYLGGIFPDSRTTNFEMQVFGNASRL